MKCRNCKKKTLKRIIKLGSQPISSRTHKKRIKLKKYPLDLYECQNCKLVQLSKVAPFREMYGSTYGYWTSLSNLMINHMKKKAKRIKKIDLIKNNSFILDIGSSDATFLNFFKNHKKNLSLFAVDPSGEKFKKSFHNKKINLIVDFFSKEKIYNYLNINRKVKKKFSLITSFAMFYDIDDPNSFCKDISDLLANDGLWIVEFSYFPLLLKNLTYDQINHEHITYYTLTTFQKIIKKNGLKIIDLSFNEINGGSVEVTVSKKGSKYKVNKSKISSVLQEEKLINEKSYKKFGDRIDNAKKVVQLFLKKNTKKTVGYGASTKGNIILNYCKITSKDLKYICDGSSQKLGRYTPGSNIKIISKEKMRKMKIDYIFVLIWSFRSEVIKQEKKFIKNGGKLIFPLPIFHIVDRENYISYLKEDFKTFSFKL